MDGPPSIDDIDMELPELAVRGNDESDGNSRMDGNAEPSPTRGFGSGYDA